MQKDILDDISQALDLYGQAQVSAAIALLFDYFTNDRPNTVSQEEYDLVIETYIFLTDGDLRKKGRDFGYSNTNEIRKEIAKLKALRDAVGTSVF